MGEAGETIARRGAETRMLGDVETGSSGETEFICVEIVTSVERGDREVEICGSGMTGAGAGTIITASDTPGAGGRTDAEVFIRDVSHFPAAALAPVDDANWAACARHHEISAAPWTGGLASPTTDDVVFATDRLDDDGITKIQDRGIRPVLPESKLNPRTNELLIVSGCFDKTDKKKIWRFNLIYTLA